MWFFKNKKNKGKETKEEREQRLDKEVTEYALKKLSESLVKESYDKNGWIPFLY